MAWIFEAQSMITEFLTNSDYLTPFAILVLCGFGLPVPEEVTLLGAGFLLFQGRVELAPIMAVCFLGTLIGDSIPFWVGRRFGRQALRNRIVRRAVHPERMRGIMRRFERQGVRAVFACRFIPGMRLPAWFTAGTLGMPYARFILVDALGAAILTPLFILVGRASGEKVAELERTVENFHQIAAFVALALTATFVGHLLITKRWPTAARNEGPTVGPTVGPTPGSGRRAGDPESRASSDPAPPIFEPVVGSGDTAAGPDDPVADSDSTEREVLDGDRP